MSTLTAFRTSSRLYPWLVLSTTSLGSLLVLLNVGTLNVALPVVTRHFHTSADISSWILLSYMLINTIFILIFGRVADVFGRQKLYLIGLLVFTISALLIGFSPNVGVLISLRVIQALGGALVITNTTALITDSFPSKLLGTALGINVLIASTAQLLGPVVGGFLASSFGWKWVFWSSAPFGLIGFIWGLFTLKKSLPTKKHEKIDYLGGLTVLLSLGGLIIGMSEGSVLGWGNGIVVLGFVLFVTMTPLFIYIEKHTDAPLLDFKLFKHWSYSAANVTNFLNFFSQTAVVVCAALYFQLVFQENAFQSGLKVLPITIGMLVMSPIAGALTRKFSARVLSTIGLGTSALGLLIIIIMINPVTEYPIYGFSLLLIGLGGGLFLTPNTTTIMTSVPPNRRGIANGIRSMLGNLGQVMSTAISLMVVTTVLPDRLKDVIYAGPSAAISHADLSLITTGYRYAFIVLFIAPFIGMFISYFRNAKD
jgi:EmrB/QacA subfamily drug resistance transporter